MDKYDWITTVFSDWAFTFVTSFLYYQDYDALEEAERNVYRKGMECFGGIAPTYHIELLDCLGFPFPDARHSDDVFLYDNG